mgnify:CR=1 FL=1
MIGIQQSVVASILYEQTSVCKIVYFSDIANGICLLFIISEIITDSFFLAVFPIDGVASLFVDKLSWTQIVVNLITTP